MNIPEEEPPLVDPVNCGRMRADSICHGDARRKHTLVIMEQGIGSGSARVKLRHLDVLFWTQALRLGWRSMGPSSGTRWPDTNTPTSSVGMELTKKVSSWLTTADILRPSQ